MQSFTAIDFETANHSATSCCQIGIVVVKDGVIVQEFASLIKPYPFYIIDEFIDIHGIEIRMVQNERTFDQIWPEIKELIESAPVIVAHNTAFDTRVLESTLNHYGIPVKVPPVFCTLKAARRHLKKTLSSHGLSSVCKHYDIPLNHHEALSDARGAALIALRLWEDGYFNYI